MAPPAKRRKRNVVHSDGEDEPKANNTLTRYLFSPNPKLSPSTPASRDPTTSPSPVRKGSAASGTQLQARPSSRATKSPSTSPDKQKARGQRRAKFEERGKSADLLALFSKQAQRSQSSNGNRDRSLEIDDIISDPISEDDVVALSKTAAPSIVGKNSRKRFGESSQPTSTSAPAPSSQRFLRPSKPSVECLPSDDQRPWADRFGPVDLDELAVHKRKVADVRKWLEDVVGGRLRQRLLVVKGAAGTGKTTTVRLLAKELACDVLEWRNPANSLGATQGFQSASSQFEEFLGRGDKFGQLDIGSEADPPPPSTSDGRPGSGYGRRLILVEEFPNTFMRSSTALTSFRSSVLQFLATNTPPLATFGRNQSASPATPIVMVISETLLTTTSASADSFTAHRLLGPEILKHPGTGVIEFNSVAPTLLAKALELVVVKEARKSGRRRTPGPLVLKRLGEIGDIRSAISSLEFLCLKGDNVADWGSKVAFTKPKRGSKESVALTKGEQDSLELISQREASLGIFHAVGKVVYNKRDDAPFARGSPEAMAEELPPHLAPHSRPKRFQLSVDSLMDEIGTDTHTFISALHENYILSCERPGPTDARSSIDYIDGCIEFLSQSDLLCPSRDIFFGGRGLPGSYQDKNMGSHVLRQDEMAFQVAVRGLLFSLPHPVKRQASQSSRGTDAFKMFYPTSLKLWRAKEETESLVSLWATKMLKGEYVGSGLPQAPSGFADGSAAFRRSKVASVGEWASSQKPLSNNGRSQPAIEAGSAKESYPPPLLSLGNSARNEMLLERLPYMAHMARRRRCSFGTMGIQDLDKMVTFHGIGPPGVDDSSDEQEDDDPIIAADETWATDRPVEGLSPRKKTKKREGLSAILGRTGTGDGDYMATGMPIQKLVLSDDDIEDD